MITKAKILIINFIVWFLRNWKTNLAGIYMIAIGIMVYKKMINASDAAILITALSAAGFFASKDYDHKS